MFVACVSFQAYQFASAAPRIGVSAVVLHAKTNRVS